MPEPTSSAVPADARKYVTKNGVLPVLWGRIAQEDLEAGHVAC